MVQVVEKPEWVSWDEIHNVLYEAHAENRAKGIIMRKPTLPGEEIKKEIGEKGVMLVAMDGKEVVGTAALLEKEGKTWYNKGNYGYLCFDSILPAYCGRGIYKLLCEKREEIAREKGLDKLSFDTHLRNFHVIEINRSQGFLPVSIKVLPDHWNAIFFKWMNGCPFPEKLIERKFKLSKLLTIIRFKQGSVERSRIVSFLCRGVRAVLNV